MESVLHLPEDDDVRRPSFAWIHNRLNGNEGHELESANALWAQEGHPFLDSYFGIIENYYETRSLTSTSKARRRRLARGPERKRHSAALTANRCLQSRPKFKKEGTK